MDETTPAQFLKGKRHIAETDTGAAAPIVPPMGMPMAPHARQTESPPGDDATYGDSNSNGYFTVQENPEAQTDVQAFGSPAGEPLSGYAPAEQLNTVIPAEPIGPTLPAVPIEPEVPAAEPIGQAVPAAPAEPAVPPEPPEPAVPPEHVEPAVPPEPAESSARPLTPDGQVADDHCCACCGNAHAPGQDFAEATPQPIEAQTLPAYDGQPPVDGQTLPAYDGQPPIEARTLPAYDGQDVDSQQTLPDQGVPAGERVPVQKDQLTEPGPTDQTPCACCGDVHPGSEPPPDMTTPAPQPGGSGGEDQDDCGEGSGESDRDEYGSGSSESDRDENGSGSSESDDDECSPDDAQDLPADEPQQVGDSQPLPGDESSSDVPAEPQGIEADTLPAEEPSPTVPPEQGSEPQTLPADEPCESEPPLGQGDPQNVPAGQESTPVGPLEPGTPANPDEPVAVDTGQQVPDPPTDPTRDFVTVPPDQKPGSTLPPTEGAVQPAEPGEPQTQVPEGSLAPGTPAGAPQEDTSGLGESTTTPVDPGVPAQPPNTQYNAPNQTTPGSGTGVPYNPNAGAGYPSGYPGSGAGGQPVGNTSPDPNVKFDEGQYLKLVAAMDDIELSLKTEATVTDDADLDGEFPMQPRGQKWEPAMKLNERGTAFGGSVLAENKKLRTALQTFVDALEEAKEVFKETDDLAAYSATAFVGEYPGIGGSGGAL